MAPTLLTILAGIIGFAIVERFARRREMRSDLRILAASIRDTIDSIVADAAKFYEQPGASGSARTLAGSIRAKIGSLVPIMQTLGAAGIRISADDELRLFRQAVTGGDFDTMARAPLPAASPKYNEIAAAGQQLQRVIDLCLYRSLLLTDAARRLEDGAF